MTGSRRVALPRDDVGFLDFQMVHEPDDVLDQLETVSFLVERLIREPVSTDIERDHLVIGNQQLRRAAERDDYITTVARP